MPSIRLPESAEVLLPFCRRNDAAEPNACFETYADLVVFAASLGYYRMNGCRPADPTEFLSTVYPIDIGVFKNQGLFPNLLLIGLGTEGKVEIARDEERLCGVVEGFASIGCKTLSHQLPSWTVSRFHFEIGMALANACAAPDSLSI